MATVFGAYMSPLQREVEIISLEAAADLKRIEAMEMILEAKIEADYLTAEALVLENGGTEDDLCQYYIEAQQAHGGGGIISSIIGWIGEQVSKFGNWIGSIFAGDRINNMNESIQGDSKVVKTFKDICSGFNSVYERLKNALLSIFNKGDCDDGDKGLTTPVAIAGIIGMDFFAQLLKNGIDAYKKNKEAKNNKDITLTKESYIDFRKAWNGVMDNIREICKLAKNIMKKYPGGERAAEILDTANAARKDAKAARLKKFKDAKDKQNGNGAQTTESVEEDINGEEFTESLNDRIREQEKQENQKKATASLVGRQGADMMAQGEKDQAAEDANRKEQTDAQTKDVQDKAKTASLIGHQGADMMAQGEKDQAAEDANRKEQADVQAKDVKAKAAAEPAEKNPEPAKQAPEQNPEPAKQAPADGKDGSDDDATTLEKLAAGAEGVIMGIVKFCQEIVKWVIEGFKTIGSWLPFVGDKIKKKKDSNKNGNAQDGAQDGTNNNQPANGNAQPAQTAAAGNQNQGQAGGNGSIPMGNGGETESEYTTSSAHPDDSFFNLEDEDYVMINETMSPDDAITELDTLFEDF